MREDGGVRGGSGRNRGLGKECGRGGAGWVGVAGSEGGAMGGSESEALIDYKIQRLNLFLEFSNITPPEDLK